MLKDAPARDLIEAVRTIHAGDALLAPSVTRRLLERFAAVPDADSAARRLDALTERERLVLVAVARGMPNAEIAGALNMQEGTVKAHVSRGLGKLGMGNRVQAAILTHEAGWV